MAIYWLMFIIPALGSLRNSSARKFSRNHSSLVFLAIFFIFIVGLRFEVGCDWVNYLQHFYRATAINSYSDWEFVSSDIGFALLNIFVSMINGSHSGVNLICALISVWGLYIFAKNQPTPLLAWTAAVPYIVIVLFQGYIRQATAFGVELLALVVLSQAKYYRFVFLILLAATFHKTALLLLPLAALSATNNKWWSYLWVGTTFMAAFSFFLQEYQDTLWNTYVVSDMASSGGGVRIAMNATPAVLFLILKEKLVFQSRSEKKLWFWIAILSLVCIPLVMLSSTAADRIALYFMPIQLFVFSRLPLMFPRNRQIITLAVVAYYATVQFVW
ncbi:MAG TPA: EpsG family protein, partial [Pseudomonadales bacterium]|nr:EpsG family protein [Pseudomonadales bacterium]